MDTGFPGLFAGMPPLFALFVFVMAAIIVARIVMGAARFARNAAAPTTVVTARVIGKRNETHSHQAPHHDRNVGLQHTVSTEYFVTFETEQGDRVELAVSGQQSGLLVEGDTGKLSYQGDWFRNFQRER